MSEQYTPEPFGYFKPEPFGWTDCAESDDDAIPLYDKVAIKLIEKQRDELLAALEEITNVFATIGMTAGCYDDELNALQKALSAIASVKANTK